MRAKVVLSASLLALVVLVPALYLHFKPDQPEPVAGAVAGDDGTNAVPAALPAILHRVSAQAHDGVAVQEDAAADLKAANHEEYVTKRKAELSEMGVSRDPGSLKTILAEVRNPDPEIRQTALTATMDFGSQDAIPALKNEITWAEDPQEKIEIQKAIDFLQLPSFALDENGGLTRHLDGQNPANN
jgi:hypothetical protein